MMTVEPYFGRGTTPERVAEAIEQAKAERPRDRPRPSTTERERFFERIADEIKRARCE